MSKTGNIRALATQLETIDNNIDVSANLLKLPFATLTVYNGSDKKDSFEIPNDLKLILAKTFGEYFDAKRQEIYDALKKEL